MRKLTLARVSYRDDFLILYWVYIMTESFHISLFEGTLRDFTPKRVVVARLHDTAVRFCTRVKFSPRYKNRGELTLG